MCVERDGGRRRKEEEGEPERETTENTSGSYELQRKTVDYVCLTLPSPTSLFVHGFRPFPIPSRPAAAATTFAVAQTRFRKPPSYV